MALTAPEFAQKWMGSTQTERAASQEHFIDICQMLGEPTPNADPTGHAYAFEKGAKKVGGGDGFADVWRRNRFAWEYKGKKKDLDAAYAQLLQYREALENPPLLVVCDLNRFEIHTNFTGTPAEVHEFELQDFLTDAQRPLELLRATFNDPDKLRPGKTRDELTAQAAEKFASLAEQLRDAGHDPQDVAHFLNKLLFCLFAEDSGLLPEGLIARLTEGAKAEPTTFSSGLKQLFGLMAHGGGMFGPEPIEWFNGGLFDNDLSLPLKTEQIKLVEEVSLLDWSEVEPAIFGTLFERGLDPTKRSQLGAHYTDRQSILRLVEPVLMQPLRRDFEETQEKVRALLAEGKKITRATPAARNPTAVFNAFLDRLRAVRVLDPACGSGNFLYLSLQALKNLERDAILWGSLELQQSGRFPEVGPQNVLGIELNSYAAELARVVIWIGQIQWMRANGFGYPRDPILQPLDTIQTRDAIIQFDADGSASEPQWPPADVIIGNPPFLGGKMMRSELGGDYVDALFKLYTGRVPAEADLVVYWHEKARAMVEAGHAKRVGLLATQSIRGGKNRTVLQRVKESGDIFLAWSDEVWIVEGAAVHISFIGFDDGSEQSCWLNGESVESINSNLTTGLDLTHVARLEPNRGIAFMGDTKGGAFDIPGELAQQMLAAHNPDARSNADVIHPWVNTTDVTKRPRGIWIIDFGATMPEAEAALYEAPFEYLKEHVKPVRETNRRKAYADRWWIHAEPRPKMHAAFKGLSRILVTPTVSKHRIFAWLPIGTVPDHQLIAFARDDDYFFGVLHSSVHELWARAMGTQLRDVASGFRYTPTSTFETFPFPEPTDQQCEAIAEAAKEYERLRSGWLNPRSASPEELAKRTLTGLYNGPPTWLVQAQDALDAAVRAAYGWSGEPSAEKQLAALLTLNLELAEGRTVDR